MVGKQLICLTLMNLGRLVILGNCQVVVPLFWIDPIYETNRFYAALCYLIV